MGQDRLSLDSASERASPLAKGLFRLCELRLTVAYRHSIPIRTGALDLLGPWWDEHVSGPWHVEVVPLPAHEGWLLRCIERPDVAVQLSTLDDMGGTIAKVIAEAVGQTDTRGMALEFSYPRGDITLYQLTVESDGTISCDQVPGLRLGSASRTQDLVQAIAVADGVPADAVGIVVDPI